MGNGPVSPRCFLAAWVLICGMCSFASPHQHAWKTFSFFSHSHRNIEWLLSSLKSTNVTFCFWIVEEIAAENSDSIYSSTPEVKAWASGTCRRQCTTYGLKQAEKSVRLQSYSLPTATWAVYNEEHELAPVLELTYLVIPMSENRRVSAKGWWSYALIVWWSVVFLMSMCKPTSSFSYYN